MSELIPNPDQALQDILTHGSMMLGSFGVLVDNRPPEHRRLVDGVSAHDNIYHAFTTSGVDLIATVPDAAYHIGLRASDDQKVEIIYTPPHYEIPPKESDSEEYKKGLRHGSDIYFGISLVGQNPTSEYTIAEFLTAEGTVYDGQGVHWSGRPLLEIGERGDSLDEFTCVALMKVLNCLPVLRNIYSPSGTLSTNGLPLGPNSTAS